MEFVDWAQCLKIKMVSFSLLLYKNKPVKGET